MQTEWVRVLHNVFAQSGAYWQQIVICSWTKDTQLPVNRCLLPFSSTETSVNKKFSYRKDSVQCGNGHSRSLKVIRCCANRRGIHDFLLALNGNLTSIFKRSWDITPSLLSSIPHLSSRWNCERRLGVGEHGVKVPRTLDYRTINLNLCYCAPHDHNACPFQRDRRTIIIAIEWRFILTNALHAGKLNRITFFNRIICLMLNELDNWTHNENRLRHSQHLRWWKQSDVLSGCRKHLQTLHKLEYRRNITACENTRQLYQHGNQRISSHLQKIKGTRQPALIFPTL